MSGKGVLLDSVIVIDHLNGVMQATQYLRRAGPAAAVSAITRAEVLTGLQDQQREAAAALLDCFRFLPIDRDVADLAAERADLRGQLV